MKTWIVVIGLALVLALGGCAATGGAAETTAADGAVTLTDGDLSAAAQLALGTVQLEDTDQAISETQAAELLPLWQAYQSLVDSDTTATVELDALVGQIQRAMTAAQIQAIANMKLTSDTLTALQESGDLGFGGFARGDNTGTTDSATGDFQPPTGGFAGGAPAGDAAGGGPGGGAMPGGGFAGGGDFGGGGAAGGRSEDDLATRQAALADMDPAEMQSRMLTGLVIRLLQTKTGEMPAGGPGGLGGPMLDTALTAVADATGLSVDDIRAQMSEGQTLTAIIEANGGDVAAVRAAIVEALSTQPQAAEMDVEQMADRMLGQ